MKISEYVQYLQDLKNKHGDVDVKVNRIFECSDLNINDTYEDPKLLYYNKKKKSVIVYREFYDYR